MHENTHRVDLDRRKHSQSRPRPTKTLTDQNFTDEVYQITIGSNISKYHTLEKTLAHDWTALLTVVTGQGTLWRQGGPGSITVSSVSHGT